MPDLIRHDNRITKTKARRHKQKKQKRGGASRPKDNSVIPPFGSAACASSSIILLHYHLIRPLARLGFCKCYRITKKTEARRHKPKKQKRGGASRPKDNVTIPPFDSAACASSSIILLHYHLIRPLARHGFCSPRFCHTGLRAGIQFFWLPDKVRHDNRITKTKARRRKPPERQFCYSTESPRQKRGGANQKNRSAAAQAARKIMYYSTL